MATGSASISSARFGAADLLAALAMNLFWGFNIIAVKIAVTEIAPMTAAFLRQVIVFVVCATALRIVPGRMRALIAFGVLSGGVFYIAINLSLAVADNVSALAIAGQLGVPFSLMLAIAVFREKIHWPRMAGMALAFAGVGFLAFDPAAAREGPGIALTAIGSMIWAICSLLQRRLVGVPLLTMYAWMGLCGAGLLGPIAWVSEPAAMRAIGAIPLGTLGWVAFSAIGSTLCGHGAMSWLLQRHPISSVTPLTLGAPVISIFAAAYWFRTPLTLPMLTGGAVAMLGVTVVIMRTASAREAT